MEIISNIALISINETLFVQLISFLIFLYVINRIMFRPLWGVMKERETYTEGIRKEIDDAEYELESVSRQLKEREYSVRQEANRMREELEAAGGKEADQIMDSARKEIARKRVESNRAIDEQIQNARKAIQDESENIALRMMEKLLDRRLSL